MAWDFDLDTDDSFFRGGFASFSHEFEPISDEPSLFTRPSIPSSVRQTTDQESRGLAEENDELRRTELSLTEKFVQISSLNERLKQQLEDCRNRFRNAIFSGLNLSNK
jgi:hypothetical protein